MKKISSLTIFSIIFLFLVITGLYLIFIETQNLNFDEGEIISIVAWNLQIFGDKKSSDSILMDNYISILDGYDIIIVQEIRDSDGSAFEELCSKLDDYNCEISSRAGRTSSKEQYGILYKYSSIELNEIIDYNPDESDRWERPPIRIDFKKGDYEFSIYTIHTKPDDATNEITNLEDLILEENINTNIAIVGDLNADCSYYDETERNFEEWNWIIKDSDDTTIAKSSCTYDRIIVNDEMFNEFITYDINKMTTEELSDHYPVSFILRDFDYKQDTSFKKFILWIIGS